VPRPHGAPGCRKDFSPCQCLGSSVRTLPPPPNGPGTRLHTAPNWRGRIRTRMGGATRHAAASALSMAKSDLDAVTFAWLAGESRNSCWPVPDAIDKFTAAVQPNYRISATERPLTWFAPGKALRLCDYPSAHAGRSIVSTSVWPCQARPASRYRGPLALVHRPEVDSDQSSTAWSW